MYRHQDNIRYNLIYVFSCNHEMRVCECGIISMKGQKGNMVMLITCSEVDDDSKSLFRAEDIASCVSLNLLARNSRDSIRKCAHANVKLQENNSESEI